MAVTPTTLEHIKLLFNSPDVYRMTSPRGRVFIIHNDEFDSPSNDDQDCLDDREGSEFDLALLRQLFSALDFVVVVHNNLSAKRILKEIDRETSRPEHKEYGMFIMIVMSHGDDGVIHGSDARRVAIHDMKRRLSVKNFPAMADKPKLLVIQACAGGGADNTYTEVEGDQQTLKTTLPQRKVLKSTVADIAIMQASHPGYKSLRDTRTGTFMIQSLIDALQSLCCHESVPDIVVRVRKMVLELCEQHNDTRLGVQTVGWTDTLTKKLFLFPGISGSETQNTVRPLQPLDKSSSSSTAAPQLSIRAAAISPNLPQSSPSARAAAVSSNLATPPTLAQSLSSPAPSTVTAIAPFVDSTTAREVSYLNKGMGLRPAGASASSLNPSPPAKAAGPPSPPPAVSAPPNASSSDGSVKLTYLVKLRHLETISTPDICYTVTLGPDSQVIHGGMRYDSLNGKRYGLTIHCIRAAPVNQLIMLEEDYKTHTSHIVTYQLNQEPTLMRKLVSKFTSNTAYRRQINKIQVQYNTSLTQFTRIDDLLIQTGGDSGKLYFYRYPTGGLIREVTHPYMKSPRGICRDTNSNIYVTDYDSNSIFNVTLNNDGPPTVTKLSCEIVGPSGITSRDGLLAVLSDVKPPELHIITTRGETVTVIELPECSWGVHDLSINTRGVVAINNFTKGIQLYELE